VTTRGRRAVPRSPGSPSRRLRSLVASAGAAATTSIRRGSRRPRHTVAACRQRPFSGAARRADPRRVWRSSAGAARERELSQSDLAALSGLPVRRLHVATEGKHPAAPSRQREQPACRRRGAPPRRKRKPARRAVRLEATGYADGTACFMFCEPQGRVESACPGVPVQGLSPQSRGGELCAAWS
jgi:hypothetical protein